MTRTPEQDIAACRAFALQTRGYGVSSVLNDAADQIERLALAAATEEWRPCPGYEGLYEVSSFGRVKSLKGRHGHARILATGPDQEGYPMVPLTKEGKRTSKTVHRLVALAFHPDGQSALHCEVAHLDGRRVNACADNLKWVSKVENRAHRKLHGTHDAGEASPSAKLTDAAVAEIRSYPKYQIDLKALGKKFGVSWRTVCSIRRYRSWKHVTPQAVECEASQSGPNGATPDTQDSTTGGHDAG